MALKITQRRVQLRKIGIETVAQKVQILILAVNSGQLDTAQNFKAITAAGIKSLGNTRHRVMITKRNRGHIQIFGHANQFFRRLDTVGIVAVQMQIDITHSH